MAASDIGVLGELLKEAFQDNQGMKSLLRELVHQVMTQEVKAHVNASYHQRSEQRKGYRNGNKPRTLNTRVGKLHLEVPQVRGCEPYHPSVFGRWQRSERALLAACAEMYFQGVSTRNVQEVLQRMCGGEISAMTVSRVTMELDDKLESFRSRRLEGSEWPYLMIDARYEKVRVDGKGVSQAVMTVIGITSLGRREVLYWGVGNSESEQSWGEVFGTLKDRGLSGLKLVTSDAHKGIVSAMSRHFQAVAWQRCKVHFMREMGQKVSYKQRKELMADLSAVYKPCERIECMGRGEEMAGKWQARNPGVSSMLREGLEQTLEALSMAPAHHRSLWSTNMVENIMKQLKKRTRVVGIFPNRASCQRLIGALLLEVHESWEVSGKPYLNMEEPG